MKATAKSGRRRRVVMARLVSRKDHNRDFDLEFGRRVGAEGRFAAMWQMVKEFDLFRGGDGRQPRLLRSVARLERRERPVSRGRRTRRRTSSRRHSQGIPGLKGPRYVSPGQRPRCSTQLARRLIAPTGLRPPAQGCAAGATLGQPGRTTTNPNGVASSLVAIASSVVGKKTQPLWGWHRRGPAIPGQPLRGNPGLWATTPSA